MPPEITNALIVVAKRPAPGQTKTRLSPPLQPEQASALYECLLLDTLDHMRQVKNTQHVIAYLPHDEQEYFHRLAPDFELIAQEGHDLGTRLDNALTSSLLRGYERVVIMDSDSPTLPTDYLSHAFNVLSNGADVVLGPCEDGGYYLIGLKKPTPRLLRDVHMSTPTVAAETIALAKEEGLHLVALPTWYDIDDVASLLRLIKEIENYDSANATHTHRFIFQNEIHHFMNKGA
jgi:rSAM/selenodomain-associated transferase 1